MTYKISIIICAIISVLISQDISFTYDNDPMSGITSEHYLILADWGAATTNDVTIVVSNPSDFCQDFKLIIDRNMFDMDIMLDGASIQCSQYRIDMNNDGVWEQNWTNSMTKEISFDYEEPSNGYFQTKRIKFEGEYFQAGFGVFTLIKYTDINVYRTPRKYSHSPGGDYILQLKDENPTQKKPILLIEGFDPMNDNQPAGYIGLSLDLINDYLFPNNYEVFFLNFGEGGADMRTNADVVSSAISTIHNLCPEYNLAVVGLSMGGVVTRYALADMEENGIDHHVGTFISYDSPQQGAHVNFSFQQAIELAPEGQHDVIDGLKSVLNSTAAKQLLRKNAFDTIEGNGHGAMFNAFYSELDGLNGDGYPDNCYNVAISNGGLTLSYPQAQLEEPLFSISGDLLGLDYESTISSEPEDIQPGSLNSLEFHYYIEHSQNILFIPVTWATTSIDINYDPVFIPTFSALDLSDEVFDEIGNILELGSTKFDHIVHQNSSFYHSDITQHSIDELFEILEEGVVDVQLSNEFEGNNLEGTTLSILGLVSGVPSGTTLSLPNHSTQTIMTDHYKLPGIQAQHHKWNINNYQLRNTVYVEHGIAHQIANFKQSLRIQVQNEYDINIKLRDPWFVINANDPNPENWVRSNGFLPISDYMDSDENIEVFLFENDQFQPNHPIYKLKAPEYHATTEGIFTFDRWEGSGVDFGNGMDEPTAQRTTDVVFHQEGATITAIYQTDPINEMVDQTIPIYESLSIPAGADYTFGSGTQILVWDGELKINGTADQPVRFHSAGETGSDQFDGIRVYDASLDASYFVLEGAITGIDIFRILADVRITNATIAACETGILGQTVDTERLHIMNTAFVGCATPIEIPEIGNAPPPDGGTPDYFFIDYCGFDNFPTEINLNDSNIDIGNNSMVNVEQGNYSPSATSPLIDAGAPDLDGDGFDWETDPDDRDPDGTKIDIGALYYHKTTGIIEESLTLNGSALISGNVLVPESVSVTIDEGTQIYADEDARLTVRGTLNVNGSEENELNFTTTTPNVSWKGVVVDGGQLNWLNGNISGVTSGPAIYLAAGSNGTIRHSRIFENGIGIKFSGTDNSSFWIDNNEIYNNTVGVLGWYSDPLISDNRIYSNEFIGVGLFDGSNAALIGNHIYDNGQNSSIHDSGILSFASSPRLTMNVDEDESGYFVNNRISNNNGNGMYTTFSGTPEMGTYHVQAGQIYGGFNHIHGNALYDIYRNTADGPLQDVMYAQVNYWHEDLDDINGPGGESIYGNISTEPTAPSLWINGIDPNPYNNRSENLVNGLRQEEMGNYQEAIESYQMFLDERPDKYFLQIALNGLDRCYSTLDLKDPWMITLGEVIQEFTEEDQKDIARNFLIWEYKKQELDMEAVALAEDLIENAAGSNLEEYYLFEMAMLIEDSDGSILLRESPEMAEARSKVQSSEKRLMTEFSNTNSAMLYRQLFSKGKATKEDNLPNQYALYPAFPNPFNPVTTIQFDLPKESRVTITVLDILGREIMTLMKGSQMAAGLNSVQWNGTTQHGSRVASGVYFIQMHARDSKDEIMYTARQKIMFLK